MEGSGFIEADVFEGNFWDNDVVLGECVKAYPTKLFRIDSYPVTRTTAGEDLFPERAKVYNQHMVRIRKEFDCDDKRVLE